MINGHPLNDKLLEPSIEMAKKALKSIESCRRDASNAEKLSNTAAKERFLPDGERREEGDLLVQKIWLRRTALIAEAMATTYYNVKSAKLCRGVESVTAA
ncbi:hypothetical protein [Lentibacillus sp. CBA3610]|uniref:hypothetical protein n=1 Tax=Lentibacillus sp. CBA3610 TaxID=2518176 RepID=UPI0015952051|nr:hypothetical protein [Lentibacillus sp. CBA3610]QKY70378.1 hypothetical protein Len3610_12915 [Lentibacillus sp. CBA3610]